LTVVSRPDVLLFTRKKELHQSNKQISPTCSKKASKSVCTSTILASPDPLSPAPSTEVQKYQKTKTLRTVNQQMKKTSK